MYIIDDQYFTREFAIPGTDEPSSKSLSELIAFVDERGRLMLLNALSYDLFKDFDSYVVSGSLIAIPDAPTVDPVPEKWRNLVDGVEYTDSQGNLKKWKGLKWTEGNFKGSVLTPYVYYYYLKNQVSYLSGVGEVKANAKNALAVNSTQRLVASWNQFVEMYQGCNEGSARVYFQDGVRVTDYFGNCDKSVSLVTFLQDNPTDYPNAECTLYDFKNSLGL